MVAAHYGTPESLKAELQPGGDLVFPQQPTAWQPDASLSNALFAPPQAGAGPRPALILFPTCTGGRPHLHAWVRAALDRGYVVLVPDFLRGLRSDCGSPPKLPNGRLLKDALDAAAHLAALTMVDATRISLMGFSKGALIATWLASSSVAHAIRPGTPPLAALVSVYGFCGLPPTPGRPQGVRFLQDDTDRPLLMLMGGRDQETPPGSCLKLLPRLKEAGAPVEWHVYPEATHQWDQPESHGFTRTAYHGEQVSYLFDPQVTEDSRRRAFEFIGRH